MQHTWSAPALRLILRLALALVLGVAGAVLLPPSAYAAGTTTLTVNTTADIVANAGACGNTSTTPPATLSLREATCLANNIAARSGNAVVITVPAGTYNLTNGELGIGPAGNANVTVNGAGSGTTRIDAGGRSRVVNLDKGLTGGVVVALSGLTITGGLDNGLGGAGIIAGSAHAATADTPMSGCSLGLSVAPLLAGWSGGHLVRWSADSGEEFGPVGLPRPVGG